MDTNNPRIDDAVIATLSKQMYAAVLSVSTEYQDYLPAVVRSAVLDAVSTGLMDVRRS